MSQGSPVTHFLHGLNAWHVVLLVVMVGSLFLQNARFTTHVEDFEANTNKAIDSMVEDIESLEDEVDSNQISLTKMASDVNRIDERLAAIDDKLSKLVDRLIQ